MGAMKTAKDGRTQNLTLPREGAFVVQLGTADRPSRGRVRGRVEHLTTGATARFDSVPELLDFLERVLRQQSTARGSLADREGGR
jgi:hypothetical protein